MRPQILSYALLCAYALLSFVSVLVAPSPPENSWTQIYLRILTAGLSLAALNVLARAVKGSRKPLHRLDDLWIPIALVVLAAWLRFRYMAGYDLWLDEDTQINGVLHDKELLNFAADHTQPPLHFFQMKLVLNWLSVSLFSARLLSAVYGSLAAWPLYSVLRSYARRELALFGTLLFVGSDLALSYSQEARPYMAGCLLFILYLKFWLESAESESGSKSLLALMVTQILLFLTISMQPQTMFAFQILSLFAIHGLDRPNRKLIMATATAATLALPVLYFAAKVLSVEPQVQPLKAGFLWKYWPKFLDSLHMNLGPLLYTYPILLIFALWRGREKMRKKDPLFSLLLLTLVYPWLFYVSFEGLMSYPIYERYILFYLPLFLVALVYVLESTIPRGRRAWGILIVVAILPFAFTTEGSLKYQDPIWRKFFAYVDKREREPGLAAVLDLQSNAYKLDFFLGANFYYTPKLQHKIAINLENARIEAHANLLRQLAENQDYRYLYILIMSDPRGFSTNPLNIEKNTLGVESTLEDFSFGRESRLIRIDSAREPLKASLAHFLTRLAQGNPFIRQQPRYLALMAGLSSLQGNCTDARQTWASVPQPRRRPASTFRSYKYIEALIEQNCVAKH